VVTDYLRDTLFDAAWFGLMTVVWLGWAQEKPPQRWRVPLAVGSALGVVIAVGMGVLVRVHWDAPSAMTGREDWFGSLVGAEMLLAGVGGLVLWRTGRTQWIPLAVGLVVALHFIPLGIILSDPALPVLGVVQLVLVVLAARAAERRSWRPSFPIGMVMGGSLLMFALIAAAISLTRVLG